MSALESLAGTVRVSRFDHSTLGDFDLTTIHTGLFKMEYVIHFHGAARPADLPLLVEVAIDDAGTCGEIVLCPACSRGDTGVSYEARHRVRRLLLGVFSLCSIRPSARRRVFSKLGIPMFAKTSEAFVLSVINCRFNFTFVFALPLSGHYAWQQPPLSLCPSLSSERMIRLPTSRSRQACGHPLPLRT